MPSDLKRIITDVVLVITGSAFVCPGVVVDYSPSAVIEGTVRDAAGGSILGASVEVFWNERHAGPTLGSSSATGRYEVELRRGLGPKVEEIGDVLVVCRTALGAPLRPDSVTVPRVVLRADREVRRTADCTLPPIE